MPTVQRFLQKVISNSPSIVEGKKYDYKAEKVDNLWHIYYREYEGEPWFLYCREHYPGEKNHNPRNPWKYNWQGRPGANQHGTY